MTHDYHDALPGYDPEQILHDGCSECEYRAGLDDHGLSTLDALTFRRAWTRAADWNRTLNRVVVSAAEAPLLRLLWSTQLQLERVANWPIGYIPTAAVAS